MCVNQYSNGSIVIVIFSSSFTVYNWVLGLISRTRRIHPRAKNRLFHALLFHSAKSAYNRKTVECWFLWRVCIPDLWKPAVFSTFSHRKNIATVYLTAFHTASAPPASVLSLFSARLRASRQRRTAFEFTTHVADICGFHIVKPSSAKWPPRFS